MQRIREAYLSVRLVGTWSVLTPGNTAYPAHYPSNIPVRSASCSLPSNQQTHRPSVLKLVTTTGYICKYMADTVVTTITTTTSQPTNSTADTTAATNGLSA
ncbi:hypothetical protein RB213_003102 [Colletotrichum asianum]